MCGRFTLTVDPQQLQESFPWIAISKDYQRRYNVAPTQQIAIVANNGEQRIEYYVWGLIPFWAKDPNLGLRLINARSETIAEKPAFRSSFQKKRCLILADGFYEWSSSPESKAKTPMYIRLKSHKPFAFAGLWDIWTSPNGNEIRSCTIITTSPNPLMAPIHNRMPVILSPEEYQAWITPGQIQPSTLVPLLDPYPADEMEAFPVSRLVNSPNNDSPACISQII